MSSLFRYFFKKQRARYDSGRKKSPADAYGSLGIGDLSEKQGTTSALTAAFKQAAVKIQTFLFFPCCCAFHARLRCVSGYRYRCVHGRPPRRYSG